MLQKFLGTVFAIEAETFRKTHMENLVSFSAKDLCSRSAMQIKMFREKPELKPVPTINQLNGISYQDEVAKRVKGLIGQEMRGTYIKDNICINFSNDIVCEDKIIEVKTVRGTDGIDWYFDNSILQTAAYKALMENSNKKLVTSKFYVEQGNPYVETRMSVFDYYLLFGVDLYKIEVNDGKKIVDFLVRKAKASLYWDTAREFDREFKRREFEVLKDTFSTEIVKCEINDMVLELITHKMGHSKNG